MNTTLRLWLAAALTAVSLAGAGTAFAQIPEFLSAWNGGLFYPSGLAVDAAGIVYVADTDHDQIQTFTSDGVFRASWGTHGTGPGQLNRPLGLAIGPDGNVYVADYGNDRVVVFSANGEFLRQWGSWGVGNGQMKAPQAIAITGSGDVYVAEGERIQEFTAYGGYVRQFGGNGHGTAIGSPLGVAVNANGDVYVARNDVYGSIWKFTGNGVFVAEFGTGHLSQGLERLAVDRDGLVYVPDATLNRIVVFSGDGAYVTSWGQTGSGPSQFQSPRAVAVAASGNVFVADALNNRIQKFAPLQGTTPAHGTTWGALKVHYR